MLYDLAEPLKVQSDDAVKAKQARATRKAVAVTSGPSSTMPKTI